MHVVWIPLPMKFFKWVLIRYVHLKNFKIKDRVVDRLNLRQKWKTIWEEELSKRL